MGANGSGKTTLLSSLLGYFVPTAGSIQLLGETYGEGDWRELRQRLGVVSSSLRELMPDEEPALHTVISGKYAMIDLWGKPKAEDVKQAKRILRQIECLSLAQRPWSVLSQGERQRILIGRALMAGPELLVLDEPCAGLDPAAREHFLQFLERLNGKPKSPLSCVGNPPRRGNYAFVYAHADLAERPGRGIGASCQNNEFTDTVPHVWDSNEVAKETAWLAGSSPASCILPPHPLK